jgi:hypothetical protein
MSIMKGLFKSLLLIFISVKSFSQSVTLDIEGNISCEDQKAARGAIVSVTRDGKPFTSFPTGADGGYFLYLPMGSDFVVDISKKGYVHKVFTVSTKNIPFESTLKKFSSIITDIELLEFAEGVDFSILDQPMNKYYYNPKKDDFEYDKEYLSEMLALIEDVKRDRADAIRLAHEKAEQAQRNIELAQQEAMKAELAMSEAESMKRLDEEYQLIIKQKMEKAKAQEIIKTGTLQRLGTDALAVNPNKTERIKALLIQYQPGVTEEVIKGQHVVIIQRVVVRAEMAWVYQKKIFDWGGVVCFRDGESITESIFELETRKA